MLTWAKELTLLVQNNRERIKELIQIPELHSWAFHKLLKNFQNSFSDFIDEEELIKMLVLHMVTKPIFQVFFENFSFVNNNPLSNALDEIIKLLEDQALRMGSGCSNEFFDKTNNRLITINDSRVLRLSSGINTPTAYQKFIVDLYDNFLKVAFPEECEKIGIVHTPIEVVDFIIHSVEKILKEEFNQDISDKNVHILDPFTGTGTFIVRLIQSGLLGSNLDKKYKTSLHANENALLAYYIASINIENAYLGISKNNSNYMPFKGICFTDTFQDYEDVLIKHKFDNLLEQNSDRVKSQKNSNINIIFGNPPHSSEQKLQNKDLQNLSYLKLKLSMLATYNALSNEKLKKGLSDNYIKAFRWSTDRLNQNNGGIIAFVTNASWIEGNSSDGMRKSFDNEFSSIYVFNLRGNLKTQGELRKKEGENIFGSKLQSPIAITILVKNPHYKGKTKIYYHAVDDYLTKEMKLNLVANFHDVKNQELKWQKIEPNKNGEWINQKGEDFKKFIILGDKSNEPPITFFGDNYTQGLVTNRVPWCYNFSKKTVEKNIKNFIDFYNSKVKQYLKEKKADKSLTINDFINNNPLFFSSDIQQFSFDSQQIKDLEKGKHYQYDFKSVVTSLYRPFQKQHCYFNPDLNLRVYNLPKLFPAPTEMNTVIYVSGIGAKNEFTVLISNQLVDFNFLDAGTQGFPRFFYKKSVEFFGPLFLNDAEGRDYIQMDAITDHIQLKCAKKYGPKVTKNDIFYYIYGLLHSKDYRETFFSDLKQSLPRIPLIDNQDDFQKYCNAGIKLANLHINYETIRPYQNVKITGLEKEHFEIEDKIRFASKDNKSIIRYNPYIKISDIPQKAFEYLINGRSPIEWILERYQVTTDNATGIKNDPNDWAQEHNNPRYILDLLLRLITVSLETQNIINSLPRVFF
ncbi:MAG: hypothetical protein LBF22_02380 [Deltaproteobacteria bacterium]|jgi:predicted helicase|nr:hypothetical protein [Deltaproteobacteria bacterium]